MQFTVLQYVNRERKVHVRRFTSHNLWRFKKRVNTERRKESENIKRRELLKQLSDIS
jgi:hypothetical protein